MVVLVKSRFIITCAAREAKSFFYGYRKMPCLKRYLRDRFLNQKNPQKELFFFGKRLGQDKL